jgi:hypothetical protein
MSPLTAGMKTAGGVKLRLTAVPMSPPPIDPEVFTSLVMGSLLFALFI